MERSDRAELFDACFYLIGDDLRLVEEVSALYYSVTYSSDLIHVGNDTVLRICQSVDDKLHSYSVIRKRNIMIEYGAGVSLVIHVTVFTDPLTETLREYGIVVHVDELILQG